MQPTAPGEGVSGGWPPRAPAYHRARCASTSSPGPRAVPSRRAVAVHRAARTVRARRVMAGAPRGSADDGRLGSYRDTRAFRDDPGRETVGATETTSALVHLRRPSRLSTWTLSDTQPFDDPAGRFAFSHNGDLRDYKDLRATYRAAGRIHGRADTEVGERWLEDEWQPDVLRGLAARGAARALRRAGQPRAPGRRRDGAPLRRQRREPRLRVPPRPDRDRVDRDLLARSLALQSSWRRGRPSVASSHAERQLP